MPQTCLCGSCLYGPLVGHLFFIIIGTVRRLEGREVARETGCRVTVTQSSRAGSGPGLHAEFARILNGRQEEEQYRVEMREKGTQRDKNQGEDTLQASEAAEFARGHARWTPQERRVGAEARRTYARAQV